MGPHISMCLLKAINACAHVMSVFLIWKAIILISKSLETQKLCLLILLNRLQESSIGEPFGPAQHARLAELNLEYIGLILQLQEAMGTVVPAEIPRAPEEGWGHAWTDEEDEPQRTA